MMPRRVYAVSGDDDWLKSVGKCEAPGFRVQLMLCSEKLASCLARLPEADPDGLLLLDSSPEADVVSAIKLARGLGWWYIVCVSTATFVHEALDAFRAGAYDYWPKTYTSSVIQKCICDWVTWVEQSADPQEKGRAQDIPS